MDISPFIPPTPAQPQPNNLREGVLLLRGLMNNLLTLPAEKSLWVELLRHMPLPASQQQALLGQPAQKPNPQPSWQPLLGELPIELVELKLPSGQKIWAATLNTWFTKNLADLPPKSLLEVKPTKDGQLIIVPANKQDSAASQQAGLTELWRKSLPQAQSPKQLLQLFTPILKPLANLPPGSHPLQPIQRFIERQSQQINNLISHLNAPPSDSQKKQVAHITQQFINHSGVMLETKLRAVLSQPAALLPAAMDEITTYDFKAQILKTLVAINQLTPHSTTGEDQWPENLWHMFLGNKEAMPSSKPNGHWLLLETLLPSLQKTLAGIQLQQAHSLAEQTKSPGTLVFELPLPSAEGWITLSAQLTPLQQGQVEEDGKQEKSARVQGATWRLFLEFNLPQNGLLAVQFLWQPGLLRGKVWANQPKLKQQLKDQLKQLKQSLQAGGINAEQLTFSDEPIPKPSPPINQPLVDIQT
jgi:hypothetical protein